MPAPGEVEPAGVADGPPASSREDVVNGYRLLLGRNTENEEVIAANRRRPVDRILAVLARSAEFGAVLDRLGADRLPPHAGLAAAEIAGVLAWAGRHGLLPASDPTLAPVTSLVLGALALPAAAEAIAGRPRAPGLAALRAAPRDSALDRLGRPATAEDAWALGLLLHGAPLAGPAPEESLAALLRAHLGAPGFEQAVLAPLLAGQSLTAQAMGAADARRAAAWLHRRFRADCAAELGGGALLGVLLALPVPDEMLARAWPAQHAALAAALARLREAAPPPPPLEVERPRVSATAAPKPVAASAAVPPPFGPAACDVLAWSESGVFLEGWCDDRLSPVQAVRLANGAGDPGHALPLLRGRRVDAERHLGLSRPAELGFWSVGARPAGLRSGAAAMALLPAQGAPHSLVAAQHLRFTAAGLFEHALGFLGRRVTTGNAPARAFADLDGPLGAALADLWDGLAATRAVRADTAFGATSGAPRISLVSVLYGVPHLLYFQVAQFARHAALDGIEFLFVSNSPELEEVFLRDAELAAVTFSARVRVVSLNGNWGLSHGNNVGIAAAGAASVAVMNPDVFPRGPAAVARLLALADAGVGRRVIGGRLFHPDGKLAHDGMVFTADARLAALTGRPAWCLEHRSKGFADRPAGPPHAVPAVTGALLLLNREFVQELGGFDEGYLLGGYEDADLCLRARAAGGTVLLDPALAFWHHEGQGAIRRPEHAGSALYNRWRFSRRWGDGMAAANAA